MRKRKIVKEGCYTMNCKKMIMCSYQYEWWGNRKIGKEGCHTMNCKKMIMTYPYCSRESHLFRLKLETNPKTSHLPNFFQDSKVDYKVGMSGVSIWVMRKRKVGNEWWHTMKCIMMTLTYPHCSRDSQLFRLRWMTNLDKSHRPNFFQDLKIDYRVDMSVVMRKRKVGNEWRWHTMNDRISSTAMMDSAAPSRLATWSSVSNFKFQERVRPNQSSFQLIGIGTRKRRVIKVHRNILIAQDYEIKLLSKDHRSDLNWCLMSVGRRG